MLPNLGLAAHLRSLPLVAMTIGICLSVFLVIRRPSPAADGLLAQPVSLRDLCLCAAAALLILVLSGEGHVFFANWDWLWRDAVLADLGRTSFPPLYDVSDNRYLLRAPLGMYVLPALVARWGNLPAGDDALLLQNSFILTLILYGFASLAGRRKAVILGLILIFSGLDILGSLLKAAITGRSLSFFDLPSVLGSWFPGLQYSSAITQLFWVPNHALPGWWMALLAMLCAKRDISVGEFGLSVAAILFWSPLVFIGILPFVATCFFSRMRETARSPRFWLHGFAALGFLPVAIYLQLDAESVPHSLLLDSFAYVIFAFVFLLVEIPHAFVVAAAWNRVARPLKSIVCAAILVLIVLPAFQFGLSNDLVMRGSIPSQLILAFAFAELLADGLHGRPLLLGAGIGLVLIGAVTPAFEIARPLIFARYAISDCNLVTVWQALTPQAWLANYLARTDSVPSWLLDVDAARAPMKVETTTCWPDHPFDPATAVWLVSNRKLLQMQKADPTR